MKKSLIFVLGIGLAATLASPASAQLAGLPVYATSPATGLTMAADYGRCGSNCGGSNPSTIGVRALIGLPMISFGVGAGQFNTDVTGADKATTLAANAALTVFGGPLIPVSVNLHVGVGTTKSGSPTDPVLGGEFKNFVVPIALAFSFNIPTPGLSIDPWIAPRVQITRQTADGFGLASALTNNNLEFGLSAGINGGLPMGLGFHIAVDMLRESAFTALNAAAVDESVITFGIGIHYTFRLPNAPMVPGI